MGTETTLPTVKSRLKGNYSTTTCVHCKTQVEYIPLPTDFHLECAQCNQTWIIRPTAQEASKSRKAAGKRRIGTDDKPLETEYYDLLGLPTTCTADEVKKAYRRLAIKFHPDKNPDDPTAGERFTNIAIAYNTLSDPKLRKQYNEFGRSTKDGGSAEEQVDPEVIFSTLFGGERFQDIIGTISLGSEMKSAMQTDEDEEETPEPAAEATTTTTTAAGTTVSTSKPAKPVLTPEQLRKKAEKEAAEQKLAAEKQKVRQERVRQLTDKLRDRLALFSEQAQGEDDEQIAEGVRTMWSIEAEELKNESYGVELLQTVGFVYRSKSEHYLASTGPIPFGIGGWMHAAKSTAHIFNATVSTVRSAYALKSVYEDIQKAEQEGVSDEERKKLEDRAAQMGLNALFKGAKLEVESVIREVCDRLLLPSSLYPEESKLPVSVLRKRAVALGILGEVYCSVKKDPGAPDGPFAGFPGGGTPPA